jgi:hypothetical protein
MSFPSLRRTDASMTAVLAKMDMSLNPEVVLMVKYKTITQIAGPLVFVEKTEPVGYKEIARQFADEPLAEAVLDLQDIVLSRFLGYWRLEQRWVLGEL